MKRLIIYILLLTTLTAMARPATFYADKSLLSEGNTVRIRVSESGIYRLTYEQISEWGLRPEHVSILGYGGALLPQDFTQPRIDDLCPVAFYMNKGTDNQFGKGDYILFYGQGSVAWTYSGGYFTHTRNHCSDYGYYFLSDAEGLQHLMPLAKEAVGIVQHTVTTYSACVLHEQDIVNLVDRKKGLTGGGREFYGEDILSGQSRTFTLDLPSAIADQPMSCHVAAASTGAGNATLTIACAGTQTDIPFGTIETADNYTFALAGNKRLNNIPAQVIPRITLSYESQIASDYGYVNYIELNAECELTLTDNALFFRQTAYYDENNLSRYCLSGADAYTEIWDITHLDDIRRVPATLSHDTLYFIGDNTRLTQYAAVRTHANHSLTPTYIEKVPNQNLHALRDIDYVIITPAAFRQEALRLAKAHERYDGLTYAVVTDQEVYNEFSSGTPDVSAYRWLMKMLYDCASSVETRPKSLLLFGDGTFDNRQLLPQSGKNILLTYQAVNSTVETKAYASDDYFTFLEDEDGVVGSYFSDPVGVMRIGVGRLPLSTVEQARQVVDKLITYIEDTYRGKWKQQLLFLADDGDNNQHTSICDLAAETVVNKAPDFIVNKIYLDAYTQEKTASGESYPIAYNRFTNLMRQGVLFMDYCGHGSVNNITNEMFLTKSDIERMTNRNQAFWMLATCGFAHFDQQALSAAELAVLNPNGGAIAVMSACRTVYANENSHINRFLCDTLFGHSDNYSYTTSIGEAARIAKNRCGKTSENKMSYILFGDPALRLNYPTSYDVVTSTPSDTLRALDEVTLNGYMRNAQGDTATAFNGSLHISVYDKQQQITTRDNDAVSSGLTPIPCTYKDYPNLLFVGKTEVQDGLFRLTFRMPKDIRYNFDSGRIVYYAIDSLTQEEGIGHTHSFVIGGSSPQAALLNDTTGPDLRIYMDNPAFTDGSQTSEYPHFFADIYDENGINAVGSGIGHDLMLVLDNDNALTYNLNDYFSTHGDYRQGQVSYAFSELKEGPHNLLFRAWDLLNNSSTASLRFTVVKGLQTQLFSVTAYPNPCPSGMPIHIRIAADRPDELLQTTLSIYDLSGGQVYHTSFNGERTITLTPSQTNMHPGIYIYRIQCQTATSSSSVAVGKLIVQ